MGAEQKWGVLVISHGSRNRDWVLMVDESICKLRIPEGMPLDSSFLEAVPNRTIQDGIHHLESQAVTDLIVIPLFLSSGSTHMEEIQYALGLIDSPAIETDIERLQIQARIHFCSPVDDDPLIAQICYEKISELSNDPNREVLLLIGHGSDEEGFGDRWMDMMLKMKEQIQRLGGFAFADIAMLHPDQIAERVAWWNREAPQCGIIVSPLFLSEGYFTKKVIPARLSEGSNVRYSGQALLPHVNITLWMEKQISRYI